MAKANQAVTKKHDRSFRGDTNAFIQMATLWSLIAAVVTALILLLTLNLLAPDIFTAVADLTNTLATAELNSTLAEGIAEVIALILPVGFIVAFIAVPFAAFEGLRRVKVSRAGKGY